MRSLSPGRTVLRFAALLLLPVGIAAAQDPVPPAPTSPPASPPPSPFPAAANDTLEVIVTARAVDTVRLEKDRLLGERRDTETRWVGYRDQATRLKANVGELRSAIDAAENREKIARKEKRDGDRIVAQTEKRRLERARDIVDARFGLREAQAEYSRVERDVIDAAIRADDAELAIAERRDAVGMIAMEEPSQRRAFQELTNRWLQALRTKAARAYDLEDRRFKVVEAQLDLLKRQRD